MLCISFAVRIERHRISQNTKKIPAEKLDSFVTTGANTFFQIILPLLVGKERLIFVPDQCRVDEAACQVYEGKEIGLGTDGKQLFILHGIPACNAPADLFMQKLYPGTELMILVEIPDQRSDTAVGNLGGLRLIQFLKIFCHLLFAVFGILVALFHTILALVFRCILDHLGIKLIPE